MKKNKNLYFIMCSGYFLNSINPYPHFSVCHPVVFSNLKSARIALSSVIVISPLTFGSSHIVKAVIGNA